MEVTFLVNISENNKTGLFNSTHERIKSFQKNKVKYNVYNLNHYDTFFLVILKKILQKKINIKKEYFEYDGVKYINLNCKNTILKKIISKFKSKFVFKLELNELQKKIEIKDILICHWGITSGILGSYIAEKKNKKVFIVHHGSDIHSIPKQNKELKEILLERMSKVTGNIFVSKKLELEAKRLGHNGNNNYVIYNGVNKDILIKETSKEFREWRKNKKQLIGFIGNLFWIKNADSLPNIFKGILSKNTNIQFLIIGDGPYRNEIELKMKNNNIDVKFLGKIEPLEVAAYMNKLDLLIIPSRNEGLPLVCLEAKLLGVKVISSDVGGLKEVLGNQNVVELDDNFIKNISQLAIEKLSKNEKVILEDKFLWENIFKQEYKVYMDSI